MWWETVIGETWVYYVLGNVIELVLLLSVARIAWTWRAHEPETLGSWLGRQAAHGREEVVLPGLSA